MTEAVALAILAIAAAVAFAHWRAGILMVLLVGMVQDPIRKLIPGQPAYYTLGAAAVFAVVVGSAWMRGDLVRGRYLALGDAQLRSIGALLLAVIGLQTLHALVRWGSPLVPAFGLVFYFAPVVALSVGLAYVQSLRQLDRFVTRYALIAAPVALTVYLSYWYPDQWAVLSDVGSFTKTHLVIYDVGTALKSYSGLFRVGEIAAWHAATAASFLLILAAEKPSLARRLLVGVLVVALVGAIVLTGRRKMLLTLTVFAVLQVGLLAILRRGFTRAVGVLMVLGLVGACGLTLLDPKSESSLYLERGTSVFSSAAERGEMALGLFWSAIYWSDGIGLGVGVAAQGAQHAGTVVEEAGGAGEAGVGKIILELGLPGLALVVALLSLLARRAWHLLKVLARYDQHLLIYGVSFTALLAANLATFSVATQLYGDPFVLVILGLVAGLLFSTLYVGLNLRAQERTPAVPIPPAAQGREVASPT